MSRLQRLLNAYILWQLQKPKRVTHITKLVGGAVSGGGVTDHGALTGLGDDDHTQYYGSGLREPKVQDANDVDKTAMGDDKILVYKTVSSKHEYEAKPSGGGDMTKAVYDTDTDNVVDNSEKLEGSTKAQVQDHTPKSHSLASHSGTGKIKTTLSFAVTGTLTTGTDKAPTLVAPCTLTIVKVKVVVKTAPTGASIIVDVNKAGTTIFTTQGNRPEIAIGATQDDSGTPNVTALAEGDKVTIDIDQVGSTVAGADLTVEVVCEQTVVFS